MEQENEKNIEKIARSYMVAKGLADDAYQIKIHDFGKKLLYPVKKIEEIMGFESAEGTGKVGRKGEFVAKTPKGQGRLVINYRVDLNNEPAALNLAFTKNLLSFEPGISQRIELETQELAWGQRWFFTCTECGKRCNVLYLSPNSRTFGCLKCRNLTYESSRINRRTMKGIAYYLARHSQLADKRERIDRPFYKGKRTKRFERFVRMYSRLDKMTQMEGFQSLLKTVSVR